MSICYLYFVLTCNIHSPCTDPFYHYFAHLSLFCYLHGKAKQKEVIAAKPLTNIFQKSSPPTRSWRDQLLRSRGDHVYHRRSNPFAISFIFPGCKHLSAEGFTSHWFKVEFWLISGDLKQCKQKQNLAYLCNLYSKLKLNQMRMSAFFCIKLLSSQSEKAFVDQACPQFHPGPYHTAVCHCS